MTSIKSERSPAGATPSPRLSPPSDEGTSGVARASKTGAARGKKRTSEFEADASGKERQTQVLSPETAPGSVEAATKQWKAAFKGYDRLEFNRMSGLASPEWTQGAVPTKATLEKLMAKLRADDSFAWLNISDGCEPRAHLVAEQLRLHKPALRHAKVFLDDEGDPNRGKLGASNPFYDAKWNQHVAIGVEFLDESTQSFQLGIIDLAVSDKLLSPGEWLQAVNGHIVTTLIDVMPVTQFAHPSLKGIQKQPFEEHLSFARMRLAEFAAKFKGKKPLRQEVMRDGSRSPIDFLEAEPVLDAQGKQIGWMFPEYDYERISKGGNQFYQRIQGSKRPGAQIDLEGRPVSPKP